MAELVEFGGVTRLPTPPERVLGVALAAGLTEVVICGFGATGDEYFASSAADGGQALWHLVRAQWRLMQTVDELGGGDG